MELFPWPPMDRPVHLASPQAQTTWPATATRLRFHKKKRLGNKTEYGAGGLVMGHRGKGWGGEPTSGQRAGIGGPSRRSLRLPASILTLPPQSQVLGAAGIPKAFLTRDPCLADLTAENKPVSGKAAGDVPGFFLLIVNGFFLKTLVQMLPFKWQT